MPRDENNEQSAADSPAKSENQQAAGGRGKILKILLPVGIAVLFGASGYIASQFKGPVQAAAGEVTHASDSDQSKLEQGDKKNRYHDMAPVIVNLNEPQVTRYLRVTLSLAIASEDYNAALKTIEKKGHELKNWLIIRLSDLSLEDVRGAKNLNRVRRDIQDSLNDRLWPGERPMIVNVSLKEWIVQ